MNNVWPVWNLSFVSNMVERAVANKLIEYLVDDDLLPRCQSAYRKHHFTETALLCVWFDMLMAANKRRLTLHVCLVRLCRPLVTVSCSSLKQSLIKCIVAIISDYLLQITSWQCAGREEIRGVINNICGSRSLMITVTVQLTSTRLVVRSLWMASHARCTIVQFTATSYTGNRIKLGSC